jgi:hypothetical protein
MIKQLLFSVLALGQGNYHSPSIETIPAEDYYEQVISALPLLPQNYQPGAFDCAATVAADDPNYQTTAAMGTELGWLEKSAHDWYYFPISAIEGKVLAIDFAYKNDQLSYRYLANEATHTKLFEPWSSSKIMAFIGAMSKLSVDFAQPDTLVGQLRIADIITSIHSYQAIGGANGDSNAYAYYFANLAGRDYLTALLHQAWLNSGQPQVKFRGAYGPAAYTPEPPRWLTASRNQQLSLNAPSSDPGMLAYRCDDCGLTGNKPMTTLVLAEFLKRLASSQRDPLTRLDGLSQQAIDLLFFGVGHSPHEIAAGGMMAGASLTPHRAIAAALQEHYPVLRGLSVQATLDQASNGNWRILHKLWAGPSETRNSGEVVALLHVCLPLPDGRREFTMAVQASSDQEDYTGVGEAGLKVEQMIRQATLQLLRQPPPKVNADKVNATHDQSL